MHVCNIHFIHSNILDTLCIIHHTMDPTTNSLMEQVLPVIHSESLSQDTFTGKQQVRVSHKRSHIHRRAPYSLFHLFHHIMKALNQIIRFQSEHRLSQSLQINTPMFILFVSYFFFFLLLF